jgi:hypothetical protein
LRASPTGFAAFQPLLEILAALRGLPGCLPDDDRHKHLADLAARKDRRPTRSGDHRRDVAGRYQGSIIRVELLPGPRVYQ